MGVTDGQVVEVKGRNGLRAGTVEIHRVAGNRVSIRSWSEHTSNPNCTGCQRARADVTAGQIVVVENRDRLGTGAIEIDCVACNRRHTCAWRERTCDSHRQSVRKYLVVSVEG